MDFVVIDVSPANENGLKWTEMDSFVKF